MADRLGDKQLETISVSLLLLDFDFEHETFEQLFLALLKYLDKVGSEHIKHQEILDLIDHTIPEDREMSLFVKNKLIIGFANTYFPKLQGLADEIKSEREASMVKGL
ncbi:hypothetical protein RNS24_07500 [Staphylococcus pseudintermedius]|uniref:hypothetical protein n=1 Tax=Staphylococcus pseudintermedius TaxID=283734 RepID=UPI001F5372F7|nr:hypothetical protein [Staphylococcus pseudintermedius]MDK3709008.1 hypothetical protein [Staphylococcus pseudintermedius]MDK3720786.1 hypothetical protein [Staphylococcus pseudintermedius]MDK3727355.1 hypothetical protein [Staphylococcus pseudintermedius]MDK3939537.1 hypothetical protein [Staphylococcus pseudintermedius]MDK4059424.1 hypothetical protein [Staphylococcus pseudintermedius]